MKGHISRLKFALQFSEVDLVALNEEDWHQLLRKIRNFLNGKGPDEVTREVHEIDFLHWEKQKVTPVLLAPAQVLVRSTLTQIVAENSRIDHGEIPPWGAGSTTVPDEVSVYAVVNPSTRTVEEFPMRVEIEKGGQVVSDLLRGDSRPYLIGSGIKEAFLFGVQMSLDHIDISYLRRCPVCTKIFFADDKRQEYCSARCSNRERNRRVRVAAKQKAMKAKATNSQKGVQEGVPEPPPLVPDTGPFKRPRKSQQAKKTKGSLKGIRS
jgi:hypothetical protein